MKTTDESQFKYHLFAHWGCEAISPTPRREGIRLGRPLHRIVIQQQCRSTARDAKVGPVYPSQVEDVATPLSEGEAASSNYGLVTATAGIPWLRPALYGALNIASATGIVFANKAVLSIYGFEFTTALTLLHTLTTIAGMTLFCQLGFFVPKGVAAMQVSKADCTGLRCQGSSR